MWLAIRNIKYNCARERDKDQGRPASKRAASPHLIQSHTTNWKRHTAAYSDRITSNL